MYTRHTLDVQPILALYLLWDNFLISEMTSIYVNNMKTPCQPQSLHFLDMLIAENVTLPQLHSCCDLLGFYTALIGSFCRRFAKVVGGCEILTAVLVKIQVIKDVSPFRPVKLPSSSGPTVQDEGTTFHRNVHNPSSVDRA